MTKTGGLDYLNKPLAPFEIVRKTDAKYSKQVSMDLRKIASQPDPRYLRYWPGNNATWASPAFCYKTLYFEQPNLERYGIGYSCPTNAIVSGGKFFADAALLPFHALRLGPSPVRMHARTPAARGLQPHPTLGNLPNPPSLGPFFDEAPRGPRD